MAEGHRRIQSVGLHKRSQHHRVREGTHTAFWSTLEALWLEARRWQQETIDAVRAVIEPEELAWERWERSIARRVRPPGLAVDTFWGCQHFQVGSRLFRLQPTGAITDAVPPGLAATLICGAGRVLTDYEAYRLCLPQQVSVVRPGGSA